MSATRFQIYLNPDQYQELKNIAHASNQPIAAIIRNAIDDYLRNQQKTIPMSDDPIWTVVGSINTVTSTD